MEKQNLKEIAEATLYSLHLKANNRLVQSILKDSYKACASPHMFLCSA